MYHLIQYLLNIYAEFQNIAEKQQIKIGKFIVFLYLPRRLLVPVFGIFSNFQWPIPNTRVRGKSFASHRIVLIPQWLIQWVAYPQIRAQNAFKAAAAELEIIQIFAYFKRFFS